MDEKNKVPDKIEIVNGDGKLDISNVEDNYTFEIKEQEKKGNIVIPGVKEDDNEEEND